MSIQSWISALACLISVQAFAYGVQQLGGKVLSFDSSSVKFETADKTLLSVPRSFFSQEIKEGMLVLLTLNDTQQGEIKHLARGKAK